MGVGLFGVQGETLCLGDRILGVVYAVSQPVEDLLHIFIHFNRYLQIVDSMLVAPALDLVPGHSHIQVALVPDQDEDSI